MDPTPKNMSKNYGRRKEIIENIIGKGKRAKQINKNIKQLVNYKQNSETAPEFIWTPNYYKPNLISKESERSQ